MAQRVYDYALNKMADVVFNAALSVSAHTGDPGDTGNNNEVSGNGYARISMAATDFADAGAGAAAAGTVVATEASGGADFGSADGGNWGTITHILFREGANLVGWVTLSTPRTINDGDGLRIPPSEIQFSVTARTT